MRYNHSVDRIREITANILKKYAGKKLAVGVSGGRDSVCLLHAVLFCGAVDKSLVTVVHVNHNLRAEADSDMEFVRGLCADYGVEFRAFSVDVKREAAEKGLSLEHAARNARYGVFTDLIKSGGADVILTAHHALDNAETVLMHMFRGSGLDGLCGMTGGNIVRPFLGVFPSELDGYAQKNGLKYVVDKTNFELDADRNFIRLKVIPLVEERYGGAVRAVNALSREAAAACELLDGNLNNGLITHDHGATVVKDEALLSPLAARYVRRALCDFSLVDVSRDRIEAVVGLYGKRTGAAVELPHGLRTAREYGGVAIYVPRIEYSGEAPIRLGANYIDGLVVDITRGADKPETVKGGAVDFEKTEGAVLRFAREGDTFETLGGVKKKLNRFFIDEKVPSRLRSRLPVIARGSDVLVVVGMQIAESVKITPSTAVRATVKLRY